jgi:hypothetical protein
MNKIRLNDVEINKGLNGGMENYRLSVRFIEKLIISLP